MKYYLTHHRTDAGNIICIGADLGDSSHEVATFPASMALEAIIACNALNNEDLANQPANSELSAEYGSDDNDLKPSDYGYCDQCGENLPTGYQDYCSTQCLDKAHPGNGEPELSPYTCNGCGEVVPEGHEYCCGQCYDADNYACVEVAPSTHSCTHCDNQVGEGIGLCHQCYMAMQPM